MPVIAGGHLQDAVGVCAHELADPQLAIFVARLLEPQQRGLLSDLLANELLPCRQPLLHSCKTHRMHVQSDLQKLTLWVSAVANGMSGNIDVCCEQVLKTLGMLGVQRL